MLSWNVAVQRQVLRDVSVEAAYVGNRGSWFRADALNELNGLTEERLKSFGLDIHNAADRALLISRMDSAAVSARFKPPYAGFPHVRNAGTVASSIPAVRVARQLVGSARQHMV
jgi:hypothetical protein